MGRSDTYFRQPQETLGSPKRSEESPGCPRKLQEAPGGPRKPQEAPGSPRTPQDTPGGGSRRLQEAPGNPRKPQEAPGGPRKPQDPQEAPGGSRNTQEAPCCKSRCNLGVWFKVELAGSTLHVQGCIFQSSRLEFSDVQCCTFSRFNMRPAPGPMLNHSTFKFFNMQVSG